MLKISTVRVPPPGLMGKFSPSESDSVNAAAGFPTSVLTSIDTPGPPSGPGNATAPATGTVAVVLTVARQVFSRCFQRRQADDSA